MGLVALLLFLFKEMMTICVGISIQPNRKKKQSTKGNTEMTCQVPFFLQQQVFSFILVSFTCLMHLFIFIILYRF